jgi:hypothetical protein
VLAIESAANESDWRLQLPSPEFRAGNDNSPNFAQQRICIGLDAQPLCQPRSEFTATGTGNPPQDHGQARRFSSGRCRNLGTAFCKDLLRAIGGRAKELAGFPSYLDGHALARQVCEKQRLSFCGLTYPQTDTVGLPERSESGTRWTLPAANLFAPRERPGAAGSTRYLQYTGGSSTRLVDVRRLYFGIVFFFRLVGLFASACSNAFRSSDSSVAVSRTSTLRFIKRFTRS